MGSDASKPLQPPEDWARNGDRFRIISPMSDISNPSEIHRTYHHHSHSRRPEPKIVDPNRRASKTVTKALTSSNPHSDLPAPSSFYFPTKEPHRFLRNPRGGEQNDGKENQNGLKKIIKKSKKVMAGCFVSEQDKQADLVQLQAIDVKKVRVGRVHQARSNRGVRLSDSDGYDPDLAIQKQMSSIEEEDSNNSSKNSNAVEEVATGISKMALHQEDAYFDRLGGFNGDASPCVQNTAVRHMPTTLGNDEMDQENSAFDLQTDDFFADVKPSGSLFGEEKTAEVVHKEPKTSSHPRDSASSKSDRTSLSSIVQGSSHIGLKVASKQTAAPRMSNSSFGDDDSSAMSYGVRRVERDTAQSAFRNAEEPLKQVAALGKKSKGSNGSRSRRSSQGSGVSKLETLFRPVLPALSADDASAQSFDPYEIKVTESAPSQLEGNHRSTDVLKDASNDTKQLALTSPSMLSIDSQTKQSPSMVKMLLSHQAVNNGEFLFTSDYGPVTKKTTRARSDSGNFSISTHGARSRLPHRSAKAVPIPQKQSESISSEDSSSASDRRVRFSHDSKPQSLDIPAIENKMSDLSDLIEFGDSMTETKSRPSSSDAPGPEEDGAHSPEEDHSPDESRIRWAYTMKDGTTSVTPYVKGKSMLDVTNSPYVRFQAAKDKWESQEIEEEDLGHDAAAATDSGRQSTESTISKRSTGIEEKKQLPPESSEEGANWSYSINGVTPQLNKNVSVENAAKSPTNRFKDAKSKFGAIKAVPAKSPRGIKTKRKGAGGIVTAKIEALDRKVIENRRLKRKLKNAKKTANPRRFQVVNTSYVRTRKLDGYSPTRVDLDKLNLMGAAKFNKLPNFDDDMSSLHSSVFMEEDCFEPTATNDYHPTTNDYHPTNQVDCDEEDFSDDWTRRPSVESSAVSTVLQEKRINHHRVSDSSYSTSASSGLSRVKKQVFENRFSLSSTGDSTTLSSIIGKENETYLPFRTAINTVKPTEQKLINLPESLKVGSKAQTPPRARKWRTLAAAAQEKDSTKKAFADWKERHGNKQIST